ncbi:protein STRICTOSIDINE SYNTHASE-LIKE 10-like [Dioscorea cayenensis subsp. rotundata]|uniref:Protein STRICTOSIDINE SYNTHASE-LIKE 10-like n=1 Tax=Dioscorea cayennensis subsp. rotundata TaxID=55577 RepID=A0AB40D728_DIOCR|nr:protein STRICTOSIDINE SYNTHASE-LIKE 10-like [Dioscorea cayenensis subsp. rotundata]
MKGKGMMAAAMAACIFFFIPSFEGPHHDDAKLQVLPLSNASGPESFAFDSAGQGPYTGVSDGRIFKWSPEHHQWIQFAVSSGYMDEECAGSQDKEKENICGRPLGLEFNNKTGDLFVADAYKGLLKATQDERILKPVVTSAEGGAFGFTNSLDIDQNSGVIYFSDSSINFQRRQFMKAIITGDRTGRVMKYDPEDEKVEVLINGLAFANGVALSRDGSFLLIVETTECRILKYKLKEKSVQVLVKLPGFPDNIKRSPRGGYWVAMHSRRKKVVQWALSVSWIRRMIPYLPFDLHKLSELMERWRGGALAMRIGDDGEVLEVLDNRFKFISEVHERNGTLWIGSVLVPFASLYKL